MFYLGIDIAKHKHYASIIDQTGKPITKPFPFRNHKEGGQALLNWMYRYIESPTEIMIGMEATGHYWLAVYSFLLDHGFSVVVLNPIQTNAWRKGTEIRKRKTDAIDATMIADIIRFGRFVETPLVDEKMFALKQMSRFRNALVSNMSDLKRKALVVLDQTFPEYQSIFSDVFGKTSSQILLEYASPSDYEQISIDDLTQIIEQTSRNRLGKKTANKLMELASNSFGVTFCKDAFSFQLKMLMEQIRFIEDQIKECEEEMSQLLIDLDTPIMTIPGVGPILGATILSEIGDIHRFDKPSKLVAYAGIDASVSQSGQFEASGTSISKRGSSHLRRALFQAAITAHKHDPVLKAFYEKKRKQGKHYYVCIGAVARKLCYIIYAILKSNKPYEVPPHTTET
ncbi:IS110-like element ISBth13 family transposase [Bacillus thuringiensis]|uniref:IS110-like element ISBth13 family transposase n=2 Tax=Bacillus thuringiensis TaxID=1428 RepID=UPI0006AC2C34|nr:IS110-like element ISBth13 family transposase [Bacillus thuringiensis]MBG9620589.1 transposase [Bacillus thuringiensis]MBG9658973.1 transposase [Bacillus thuringiensis]OTW38764.1 IS110 family transposase [Bacillus thuringiensis serovar thuringiensis]OTX24892.1 IS110 family transposase [Bacillus thuringiensis serovar andalousiensis]